MSIQLFLAETAEDINSSVQNVQMSTAQPEKRGKGKNQGLDPDKKSVPTHQWTGCRADLFVNAWNNISIQRLRV